jgi:hypothetical protein
MKILASCYLGLVLAGCGGDPFTAAIDAGADALSSADPNEASRTDAGDELAAVLEHDGKTPGADAGPLDAGARAEVGQVDAGEPSYDGSQDHFGGNLDAGDAGDVVEAGPACDPNYGDASPGGSCCVHVWATPTMGAVLCTVDGSRWCWQTGLPCSAVGSKCVAQSGVEYCAP